MRFLFLSPQTNELRWTAESLSSLLQDTSQHAWASRMRKTNNIRSRACAVFFSVGHQQKSESWQVLKQTWLCPPYSISLWSLLHKAACKVIKCLAVAHSFKWLTQACPERFFNAIHFLNLQCTFFWHPEMSYQTKQAWVSWLTVPTKRSIPGAVSVHLDHVWAAHPPSHFTFSGVNSLKLYPWLVNTYLSSTVLFYIWLSRVSTAHLVLH